MNLENNSMEKTLSFGLDEIAKWQLNSENSKIKLPALQRGFVWKVSQMESLWDSILRGFPVGSLLLSKHDNGEYDLLDGQQRATSIALGYYNPWEQEKYSFWSLKKIPVIWIDLLPNEITNTQKFVIRIITQSHPWGYQRKDNNSILTISDRRSALKNFREVQQNKECKYINLSPLNVFPYDANLPVPLAFLINAIVQNENKWKDILVEMCKKNLPECLKTKHFSGNEKIFTEQLYETLHSSEFSNDIFNAIKNLKHVVIPAIVVKQEILKAEDEQTGEDPTLFVRLNSSGTKITGEELIYSIYKAAFPKAKELVEKIAASFVAPSLVISLVSRLALAEINNKYPNPISVNDFRKIIQDDNFKNKLEELIGIDSKSPAAELFKKAFELLLSKKDFAIPPVLVKSIVKHSPDLFLLLLQWIKLQNEETSFETRKTILATITALSWFGSDNNRFVREVWNNLSQMQFWRNEFISKPFYNQNIFIIHPFISPELLRKYLIHDVVEKNTVWNNLNPDSESEIIKCYRKAVNEISIENDKENMIVNLTNGMWSNFIIKLFWCKPIILFAQREYFNKSFEEFNQMETLEDTNTPWDWDHIYPDSWVYCQQNVFPLTREWNRSIGNLRALSLEENRSENNSLSPKERLTDVMQQSFIKENDWQFWSKIEKRIYDDESEEIKNHLSAIVHRFCNIYEEWYSILNVGEVFGSEK
jgi:Protein of unknown function DUF262.